MNARRRSGRDVRAMARPRPLELDRYDLAAAVQIDLPLGDAPALIRPMPSHSGGGHLDRCAVPQPATIDFDGLNPVCV